MSLLMGFSTVHFSFITKQRKIHAHVNNAHKLQSPSAKFALVVFNLLSLCFHCCVVG